MMNQTSERRHSDAVPGYIQQWWWILRVSASSARSCLSHWQQQQYNNNATTQYSDALSTGPRLWAQCNPIPLSQMVDQLTELSDSPPESINLLQLHCRYSSWK